MQRLTRYIVFELLRVFLIALVALTLLLLLGVLGQEAIRQGLGPVPLLRMIPYVVPIALRFAVPATVLFAVCSVFGRIASENEVVALKSLGISPWTMVWPALVLAFLLSLLTVAINDVAVSWGKLGVQRVVLQSVEHIAYSMLRTGRSYRRPKFSISVRRVEGRRLIKPTLVFHTSAEESTGPITFTADEAELRFDREGNTLRFHMVNGELEGENVTGILRDEIVEIPSPLNDLTGGPSDYSLREIPRQAKRQLEIIERLEQELAVDAAFAMTTGDFQALQSNEFKHKRGQIASATTKWHRLQTEPWRRWANGFSCLFFVMVGVPLATRFRTADFWATFAGCFLPILVIYYPLLMYGTDRAKVGQFPPYSVWLSNLVLCVVGICLLLRMRRH